MSGRLTTHILDVAAGAPAASVAVSLYRCDRDERTQVVHATTNADGRTDEPLLTAPLPSGMYELVFAVGAYFAARGTSECFYDDITVRFRIGETERAYHVPLLVSPWSYTTYRGS